MTDKAGKRTLDRRHLDDPLGLQNTVRDGDRTDVLLANSKAHTMRGLWAMNGIEEFDAAQAAQFFLAAWMGLNLCAAKAEHAAAQEKQARIDEEMAALPVKRQAKAKRMIKAYTTAMDDAAATISAPVQLELF